jgi:hypothetical protein
VLVVERVRVEQGNGTLEVTHASNTISLEDEKRTTNRICDS